ncbi:MAG: hypothetical protein A2289_24935 [Deltaproteobacteria bacterium RIFOXYA12_FULL_58_15]|nr:MAG: hypothetical protein A2289_24935 [Deltaproteobacteria bacterium RIFOXYA12_FULL_58_15]
MKVGSTRMLKPYEMKLAGKAFEQNPDAEFVVVNGVRVGDRKRTKAIAAYDTCQTPRPSQYYIDTIDHAVRGVTDFCGKVVRWVSKNKSNELSAFKRFVDRVDHSKVHEALDGYLQQSEAVIHEGTVTIGFAGGATKEVTVRVEDKAATVRLKALSLSAASIGAVPVASVLALLITIFGGPVVAALLVYMLPTLVTGGLAIGAGVAAAAFAAIGAKGMARAFSRLSAKHAALAAWAALVSAGGPVGVLGAVAFNKVLWSDVEAVRQLRKPTIAEINNLCRREDSDTHSDCPASNETSSGFVGA